MVGDKAKVCIGNKGLWAASKFRILVKACSMMQLTSYTSHVELVAGSLHVAFSVVSSFLGYPNFLFR